LPKSLSLTNNLFKNEFLLIPIHNSENNLSPNEFPPIHKVFIFIVFSCKICIRISMEFFPNLLYEIFK
jgi:hypothetical protein